MLALASGVSAREAPLRLESLPDELLQLITSFLPSSDLKSAALVCKCLYRHATDFLWQSVCLEDTWSLHRNIHANHIVFNDGEPDEHDDTPIIQKLWILMTNRVLAQKVQVLTHRCHLPTPNIFSELPHMYFNAEDLSQDARLHNLLLLAIKNMVNVHTLRVIYGHKNLTRLLLNGFLDPGRPRRIPLRRLWLESCSLLGIAPALDPSGLESLRFRRLRAESSLHPSTNELGTMDFRLSRGGHPVQLHDGSGGWLWSTVELEAAVSTATSPASGSPATTEQRSQKAQRFDDVIWSELHDDIRQHSRYAIRAKIQEASCPPVDPMIWLVASSASTLTSLTLDWILWRQKEADANDAALLSLRALTSLRFPHLRAFQARNAVVPQTKLPDHLFLFEGSFLEFLEDHPKIQCLAWPLDRFYSHIRPSVDAQTRTRKLVTHLGTILTDLRVDSYYAGNGETFTDESRDVGEQQERARRRKFIEDFAPCMTKIEHIKLEGGLPRDEKREILRALHFSPLKKIVMIGVSFPTGNFWGPRGALLKQLDPGQSSDATYNLEEEDLDAILDSYKYPSRPSQDFQFTPSYGWPSGIPFLNTIALHHADTIQELKLCGYNGSPILSALTPMTRLLLHPLQLFPNLRQLVVSFWLLTFYEDDYRDGEIIQSWKDARSPSSTALVVVTPPTSPAPSTPPLLVNPTSMPNDNHHTVRPQEFNRWAVVLKTRFTPSALAYRVVKDIGPHLSSVAKEQPGGVRVRASFCLGTREGRRSANDIFDLDIRIGRNDQLLEFVGPREEAERGRWWQKLENRRWF